MKVIGRLIKKTTGIGFKRINRKQLSYRNQLDVLLSIIKKAQNTEFGFFHGFKSLIGTRDVVSRFQNEVPIMDYEEFHDRWLHKSIEGQSDSIWPGKIKYYALSSGTTGSPSKRIPVSMEMIRSFQRSSLRQYSVLHALDLDEDFFSGSGLAVGGTTQLKKRNKHYEGDLSGILKKHTTLLIRPMTKPGDKIASLSDWNEKLDRMVEKAPEWNIGIVAGIPSWCLMLMERIIHRHQLSSIHDIWPNFRVYVHGGVYMDPYTARLQRICKKEVYLFDTYLASEGYFGFQIHPNQPGMKLLINNGIFFEFIPFDSRFFNEDGELISQYKALTISEVKENVDYALVISTNAGLWRYLIGDLVRFVDVADYRIIISGRIKQFLSLCGEHLSLDNLNHAFQSLIDQRLVSGSEFTIMVEKEAMYHHWFIELENPEQDSSMLQKTLDNRLFELNDDYRSARKYSLNPPKITGIKPGTFYAYMQSLGKVGAQHKLPRVMNEEQSKSWFAFLENPR